jgi:hypothetical protein
MNLNNSIKLQPMILLTEIYFNFNEFEKTESIFFDLIQNFFKNNSFLFIEYSKFLFKFENRYKKISNK